MDGNEVMFDVKYLPMYSCYLFDMFELQYEIEIDENKGQTL